MFKFPCQPGCLMTVPGACVKYTGPTIQIPRIFQNTDLDTVVQILSTNTTGGSTEPVPCAKPVTYVQLDDLFNNGLLEPGCWYRLTDFQTMHYVYNIQISNGMYDKTITDELHQGPVEELLLQATSPYTNTFHGYAANGDEILYVLYSSNEVLPGHEKGAILRRRDRHLNIDMPLDWRNVKWLLDGVPYRTFNGEDGSPENYMNNSKNIFIAGGPAYRQFPVIIFTSSSPFYNDIHITECTAFVVSNANGVDVTSTNVVLPAGGLRNMKASFLAKANATDTTVYADVYNPNYVLP